MPVIEHTLQELKSDIYACIFNNFYSGWEYRRELGESYEDIAKDCDASAKEMMRQYEEKLKEELCQTT